MSNRSRLDRITGVRRKACAAFPALALIGGGIALTVPGELTSDVEGVAASNVSPAVVVPDIALTMPGASSRFWADPNDAAAPGIPPWARFRDSLAGAAAAGRRLPAGTLPGSGSSPVSLDGHGVPVRALEAYRTAASLTNTADPACHIDWALIGAIGRVESNHARFGGNQLDTAGVAQPGIIGIPLNGSNGTARIMDSDRGMLDRDAVYDRAVGPMQFIPSTWRVVGVDADGDGVKNPQDLADAATATAVYLCSGPGDLSHPGDLRSAILRYNASDSYVRMVTGIAAGYRDGVIALPTSALPAATAEASTSGAGEQATRRGARTPDRPDRGPSVPAQTSGPTQRPSAHPLPPVSLPPVSAPVGATPVVPVPVLSTPAVPVPVTAPAVPDPVVTAPAVPDPVVTAPAVPDPVVTTPVPLSPCMPDPTVSPPAVPDPASSTPPVPVPGVTIPVPLDPCMPDPVTTAPVVPVP